MWKPRAVVNELKLISMCWGHILFSLSRDVYHSTWDFLDVVWTLMRDRFLYEGAAQRLFYSFKNHRLVHFMRSSLCSQETQGTIEQACEECRKRNWSDICRLDRKGRRRRITFLLFWHTDVNDNVESGQLVAERLRVLETRGNGEQQGWHISVGHQRFSGSLDRKPKGCLFIGFGLL